jgi:putative salt-induced outer membrane protein YdiY
MLKLFFAARCFGQRWDGTSRALGLAAAVATALIAGPSPAQADTVYLADGSQINGTVKQMQGGQLTIETSFAGTLTVDAAKLQGLTAERELAVTLDSGDRIVGIPQYSPDTGQRLTETAFGAVQLDDAELASVRPADAAAKGQATPKQVTKLKQKHKKQVKQIKEEHEKQVTALEEEQAKYDDPWSLRLQFGLSGATGNNERLNFDGRTEALRETPDERLSLFAAGQYAEEQGQRSENEIRGGAKLEVDVSSKTFVYGKTGLEFDEFEDLDLRTTLTAGLGYFFWEKEDHELKGRLGAGYQHESFMNGVSQDEGLLELGYDWRYDLNTKLRLTQNLTYYPTLGEPFADYRLDVETAGEVPLSEDQAWKLRLGVRNEYNAMPQPGVERLDTFYFLDFVYDVK